VTGHVARGQAIVGLLERVIRRSSKPTPDRARTIEPGRRGTKSHESRPTWRQGGPPPIRSSRRSGSDPVRVAKASRVGVDPEAGESWRRDDRPSPARGAVASLPREGRDLVNGSTRASSRSSGNLPFTGRGAAKGREARGAAERGHGQDAPSQRAWQGARRCWRLAHTSALEAFCELGRCLTVMRGGL